MCSPSITGLSCQNGPLPPQAFLSSKKFGSARAAANQQQQKGGVADESLSMNTPSDCKSPFRNAEAWSKVLINKLAVCIGAGK